MDLNKRKEIKERTVELLAFGSFYEALDYINNQVGDEDFTIWKKEMFDRELARIKSVDQSSAQRPVDKEKDVANFILKSAEILSNTYSNSQSNEKVRMQILRDLYSLLESAGVDSTSIESVELFIQRLKIAVPDGSNSIDTALCTILGEETTVNKAVPHNVATGNDTVIDSFLNDEQNLILEKILKSKGPIFVTGQAGTGKSRVLEAYVQKLTSNYAVLAPTGIAALTVGGVTIHSFFRFPKSLLQASDVEAQEKLKYLDTLIIDEISMVGPDVMECINLALKKSRNSSAPFGGVKIVMFGDLFQLQPVYRDEESQRYIQDRFKGSYFYYAPVFRETGGLVFLQLNKVMRQADGEFQTVLQNIRYGHNIDHTVRILNQRAYQKPPSNEIVTLTPKKSEADRINNDRLNQLTTTAFTYEAHVVGKFNDEAFPTSRSLVLKEGSLVMFVKNDLSKRWVNGSLGTVTKLTDNQIFVSVKGIEYEVQYTEWEQYVYRYDPQTKTLQKEVVGTFSQVPLRLAWAITIHKSQGQTYDSVSLDIGTGAFTSGQTYVALSRCRSITSLYLARPLSSNDIIVDEKIVSFYKHYLRHKT